jgi:hypothetical protein
LLLSVCRLVQVLVQKFGAAAFGQPHLPSVHVSGAVHLVPQAPQLLLSSVVSVQRPVPAGQWVGYVALQIDVQTPFMQLTLVAWGSAEGLQIVPQAPQLFGSVWVATQASPHFFVSFGQAHWPALQISPVGQAVEHRAPQLFCGPVAWQLIAQQIPASLPVGVQAPLFASWQPGRVVAESVKFSPPVTASWPLAATPITYEAAAPPVLTRAKVAGIPPIDDSTVCTHAVFWQLENASRRTVHGSHRPCTGVAVICQPVLAGIVTG